MWSNTAWRNQLASKAEVSENNGLITWRGSLGGGVGEVEVWVVSSIWSSGRVREIQWWEGASSEEKLVEWGLGLEMGVGEDQGAGGDWLESAPIGAACLGTWNVDPAVLGFPWEFPKDNNLQVRGALEDLNCITASARSFSNMWPKSACPCFLGEDCDHVFRMVLVFDEFLRYDQLELQQVWGAVAVTRGVLWTSSVLSRTPKFSEYFGPPSNCLSTPYSKISIVLECHLSSCCESRCINIHEELCFTALQERP